MSVDDALSDFPIMQDKSRSLDDKKTYVLGLVFHEISGLEKALGYAVFASTFTLEKREELDNESEDTVAFIEKRDEQCANYNLGELIKECEKIDEFKSIVENLKHLKQRCNFFIHHFLEDVATPIVLHEEQHNKLLCHLADLALRMHGMAKLVVKRNEKLEEDSRLLSCLPIRKGPQKSITARSSNF